MDAYQIQQEIFKRWQQVSLVADAGSIKKSWANVPVHVDGKIVTNVKLVDGKIILETK